jgi:hypothetical protein
MAAPGEGAIGVGADCSDIWDGNLAGEAAGGVPSGVV